MNKVKELSYTELKQTTDPAEFDFQTTAELKPLDGIIGQERAAQAFDFGLEVPMKGYNIYLAGPSGTGKTTYAKKSAEKKAAAESVPCDWCYVYNFQDEKYPVAISFPAGTGRKFRKDMENLVAGCKNRLRRAFSSGDYDKRKNRLARAADEKENDLVAELNEISGKYGFAVVFTDAGLSFHPLANGQPIDDATLAQLPPEARENMEAALLTVQEKTAPVFRRFAQLEKESSEQLDELDRQIGLRAIGRSVQSVRKTYQDYPRAVAFLDAMQEDILKNLSNFQEENQPAPAEGLAALLGGQLAAQKTDVTEKYKVNLLVDNAKTKGAPVIVSFNPTCTALGGEIEYSNDGSLLSTDFTKIKGGLLHQANGGYLIVQAYDVLTSPQAWEILRRVMKTGEISMDPLRDNAGSAALPFLKPDPIPADLKIIMVGSSYYYDMLSASDEDFLKFFKIRAEFDYEMPRTHENAVKIAQFIKRFAEHEHTPEFDVSAVCAVVEHASRCAERQDKLSTRFNHLAEVLCESATWARLEHAAVITSDHIRKAIAEKEERLKQYEEKLNEMLEEEVIMIATDGREIGQINGLAVLDMGDYSFGVPTRITATTCVGEAGIINVEKEARMSGQTHDKGVQIISGYLGQKYAQKFPLSVSCRVCFEQSYSGIDGDSASSTELYCILSSLSDLPIRQDLAVTGSVNQKGQIQAIGGATHKIEGFFDLCRKRGLTGKQGVLIPGSNVNDLVLKDEVVEAVKNGQFHIYPVRNIDEGLSLLLDCPAGEADAEGNYPPESIHGRAYAKLKAFSIAARDA